MGVSRLCGLLAAAACAGALAVSGTAAAVSASGPAAAPTTKAEAGSRQAMSVLVHEWSTRLNAGDYAGIAQLFALPALIVQPPYEYRLTTSRQVALWHSLLPCSGTVLSIAYRGRFATAVFRLGNRRGSACDQPGGLAAVRFEIMNGKIHSWVQVPVPASGQSGPIA